MSLELPLRPGIFGVQPRIGWMLTDAELGRVCVVLVGARNPNNIGAAARAMQDFGFRELRLVNEYRVPLEDARSAVGAADLLRTAVEAASVAEAVADCSLVVGTTAIGERAIEHRLMGLVEAAGEMIGELRRETHVPKSEGHGAPGSSFDTPRVALLFGSEKTGLTNDALSHCDWLLTVPMHSVEGARHLSMNLGQAVAVCLYELVRGAGMVVAAGDDPAGAAEQERVTELLRAVMTETEYTRRFPANCDEAGVRRLVRRMGMSREDAPVWMGILRQMLWKLRGKPEWRKMSANFK